MTPKKFLIGVVMLFVMGFIVLYKWTGQNAIPNQKTINERNSGNIHDDLAVLNSVKKHDDSAVLNSVKKHDDSAVLNSVKKHDDIAVHNSVNIHDDIAVYLRMTTAKELFPRLYESVVVRSISYFWPKLASLFVVLDAERSEDHVFGGTIQKSFPYPRVCYMEPITNANLSGYDRMQRDMFYPEKCTSKKLVGFIDTDTIFIARVIPEVLFEDGKPIIIAVYGTTPDWTWDLAARSTAAIFKTKEVMKCMTYFPVIFKVEHIIAVRNYLEKLHNMSIENILHTKQSGFFSQFNLMCHYVWTFHRHEYSFYFQHKHFPTSLSKGREDASYYKKYILPDNTHPFPRISDHYKYHNIYGNWKNQGTFRKLLKAGVCYAGGFERCSEKCKPFKKDSLRKEMFIFDHNDWTWDTRCISAQRKYYDETSKYDTPEYREVIQKACDEVDTLTLRLP